jgi:ribosomal protein L11 methyltransferase
MPFLDSASGSKASQPKDIPSGVAWLVVDIEHKPEDSAWAENVLESHGFEGWEIHREIPDVLWRLYFPLEGEHESRLASLRADLEGVGAIVSTQGEIRDEDWAENWKEFYHPFAVGQRLVVAPSWEEPPAPMAEGRSVLRIDPGSAFGTGYHESTRLCLLGLEALIEDPQWGHGSLLDYGTGSGILAIGALLLGCPKVIATDRDPVSVKVASENLRLNGFPQSAFRVEETDVPKPPGPDDLGNGPRYPFVVANLTADILSLLGHQLVAVAQRHILLGGIVEKRAQRVVDTFTNEGCTLVTKRQENDWVSYHFLAPERV